MQSLRLCLSSLCPPLLHTCQTPGHLLPLYQHLQLKFPTLEIRVETTKNILYMLFLSRITRKEWDPSDDVC